jgi:hypothetical protein
MFEFFFSESNAGDFVVAILQLLLKWHPDKSLSKKKKKNTHTFGPQLINIFFTILLCKTFFLISFVVFFPFVTLTQETFVQLCATEKGSKKICFL